MISKYLYYLSETDARIVCLKIKQLERENLWKMMLLRKLNRY